MNNQDPISVDDIIARRKLASQHNRRVNKTDITSASAESSDDDEANDGSSGLEDDGEERDQDSLTTSGDEDDIDSQDSDNEDKLSDEDDRFSNASSSSADDTEPETQAEKDRKTAFFDLNTSPSEDHSSFLTMNLSRPILKAITNLGFNKPTPIQAAAIPVALLGKDIVGGAVTGSGKTATFLIPMLERLLYRERGKKAAAVRCLVLVPTRELAVQCFETGTRLANNTDIRFCLIVGMLFLSIFSFFSYKLFFQVDCR